MTDNIGDLAPNSLTLPDLQTSRRHATVNPTGLIGMSVNSVLIITTGRVGRCGTEGSGENTSSKCI